jgi:uncharacterized cupin superfamily protein
MTSPDRHPAIIHWTEIEKPEANHYRGDDELMTIGASLGRHFSLKRLGIHHERLLPGRRTSYPHAESLDEEFVYVIEGNPEVWLDGVVHQLKPGDSVGFPAGTGLAHTFLNNTDAEVHLLVVGEKTRPENRIRYVKNPEFQQKIDFGWDDWPERPLGGHDGLTDKVRAEKAAKAKR